MSALRNDILDWLAQGRLRPESLPIVLRRAGMTPTRKDWMRFLDRLCLWLGAIFIAAAVIFFFAYNWQEMGRYAKFGIVELLIVACMALCWRLGVEQLAGKAVLLGTALLIGALLALVGQIYQTGADTYELFAAWAVAVLPLVAIGRFAALWLLWLALLNAALSLYFHTFGVLFGLLFDAEKLLWTLFAFNTVALCAWEWTAQRGVTWLQERWAARVLIVASGGFVTALAAWAIVDEDFSRVAAALAYVAWMSSVYLAYRRLLYDLFALAGGVLSAIVVVAVFLAEHLVDDDRGAAYLLIGLIVIGLSAAGGIWLKSIAAEERA